MYYIQQQQQQQKRQQKYLYQVLNKSVKYEYKIVKVHLRATKKKTEQQRRLQLQLHQY